MRIEDCGLIYDATQKPAAERIAYFTSLCPTRDSILAGCHIGPSKDGPTNTIRLFRSRDGGSSWQDLPVLFETTVGGVPGSLSTAEMVEVDAGELLLFATWFDRSDPDRPLYDPETEGVLHGKQLKATSTDDGKSWSPWEEVPTPGLTGCATCGPPLRWSDGTIAYAFESFKEFDDLEPAHHAAWVVTSRDRGHTFSAPILVANDPKDLVYYWDQRLCPADENGAFLALFWSHDRGKKRDLTVHMRRCSIADGDDAAGQRSAISDTGIPGQIAAPLLLGDGRILAFVVDRQKSATMKLWVSSDGGATWPESECLLVYSHDERAELSQGTENIDFNQYWEDMGKWTFGHPAIRPLDERRVLLAYYAGTPDTLSLHWARVDVGKP